MAPRHHGATVAGHRARLHQLDDNPTYVGCPPGAVAARRRSSESSASRLTARAAGANHYGMNVPSVKKRAGHARGTDPAPRRRGRPLVDDDAQEVLRHLTRLWGFNVSLEAVHEDGSIEYFQECKAA